jgi:hypothetical protein
MNEPKSIHDVAAMVGIDRKTSEEILAQVRANKIRLDGCRQHYFSVCVDRSKHVPIENPTDAERCFADWKCENCGGVVDFTAKYWYNRGRDHERQAI